VPHQTAAGIPQVPIDIGHSRSRQRWSVAKLNKKISNVELEK
jgi:hypothetical protein